MGEAVSTTITALALAIAMAGTASAESLPQTPPPTADRVMCTSLKHEASIPTFSDRDTMQLCQAVSRVMDIPTVEVLQDLEKSAYVLHRSGYENDYPTIAAELAEVIRLRGLRDHPDRWAPTINVVWKSWQGLNGAVTPADVVTFLRASGPMAKTLDDDGLMSMLVFIKRDKQGWGK